VLPVAAATKLLVDGLVQWVCFLFDRWQEDSLQCVNRKSEDVSHKFPFDVLTSIVSFLWAPSTEKVWLTV
jgi:hypothetical protein